MINKFHKTSYSRQPNFNAVSSSHGRRNPLYQQTHYDWANKYQHPIEKKIEIESSLLFNQKTYQKPHSKVLQAGRQPVNKSEAKFYQTSLGFTQGKDRPHSKQEPRPRGKFVEGGKIKTEVFQHDRPQTSKGVRVCKDNMSHTEVRERQKSENEEECPINIKVTQKKTRTVQSSYSRRPTRQSNISSLDTALDPQFLNLFAN